MKIQTNVKAGKGPNGGYGGGHGPGRGGYGGRG
jgi:hypothetical protein